MAEGTAFQDFTDAEIRQLYSAVIRELRARNIIRTKNVTGDLGEYAVVDHYNRTLGLPDLQLAPPSNRDYDAISTSGERYAIKSATGSSTGGFYGLPSPGSDEEPVQQFDYAVIVKFDEEHEIQQIIELTWQQFLLYKRWHSTTKAWNLPVSQKLAFATKVVYPYSS